jgi:hypothetical protein
MENKRMTTKREFNETKFKGQKIEYRFAHVIVPTKDFNKQDEFSIQLLIPKTDTSTMELIRDAFSKIEANSKSHKLPIKDGDKEFATSQYADSYRGYWVINAKSKRQPLVIDGQKNIISSANFINYSGTCNVTLLFKEYELAKKTGVTAYLQAVQFTELYNNDVNAHMEDFDMYNDYSEDVQDFSDEDLPF